MMSDYPTFDQLYRQNKAKMVRFAQSYLADQPHLAEDIVVDAFIYYWEHRNKFDSADSNPVGYIFNIIRTRCLNYLRDEKKAIKSSDNEDKLWDLEMKMAALQSDDPNILFASEISALISKTVKKLPKKTQKVFYLKKIAGKRYSEIAETLDISVKTVEYHMSKAMHQLRQALSCYLDTK